MKCISRARRVWLALASILAVPLAADVIYDNTRFPQNGYAVETREYGDQLDFEGTARTLTELTVIYFGDLIPDGDEMMKVRLYRNEVPWDLYRDAPVTLLYESGNIPFNRGYNALTLSNLNVRLPVDTATLTVEFKGLKPGETAGLLFHGPPTVGWSFNEFWGRTPNGGWTSFLYTTTDFTRRANAGIKLVARPEADPAERQTDGSLSLALRDETGQWAAAQTFTPQFSGRLDRVELALDWTGDPVELSIFETSEGLPGTNLLGSQVVAAASGGQAVAGFFDQWIYLEAGKQYAIQARPAAGASETPQYLLRHSDGDAYPGGSLWRRAEGADEWAPVSGDAAFAVAIVPAAPAARFVSPRAGQVIPLGARVRIGAALNLPRAARVYRVRFFDGDRELEQVLAPPYEVLWHATNSGPRTLRLTVEDTFGRPFRAENRLVVVQAGPPVPVSRAASIERGSDGAVTLRFPVSPNEKARLEYSEDLTEWKTAPDQGEAGPGELLYKDDGPPKTEAHPKDSVQRFYRFRVDP